MAAPIDIINRFNHKTGKTSSPEQAANKGLWHRGAHVILLTPSGRVLIQQRHKNAIQRPGLLDIGAGGFVDTGELPEETAVRETAEETGIQLTTLDLIFLGTTRYNHHWKYGKKLKISRAIIYNYVAILPSEQVNATPQSGEVEWVGFIPAKSALWLIHKGSLRRFGKLVPTYSYYRRLLGHALKYTGGNF